MTLNTSLIERESRMLYMRYLKDPRIPDELCSDIYLEFIKRMEKIRKKREKEEGKKRIDQGVLGTIMARAVQTILQNKKKEEEKEAVLTEIVNRNASQFWCKERSGEEKSFFSKIALFLKDWTRKKENYPQYLRIFLLYHAFYLSEDFIRDLELSTDADPRILRSELEVIKEDVREKNNKKLDNRIKNLDDLFYCNMKKHRQIDNLMIRSFSGDEEEKYLRTKQNRRQTYNAIKEMKFVPTWIQIEQITGISERKARYAYQAITKAIKDSFKDDSYWG